MLTCIAHTYQRHQSRCTNGSDPVGGCNGLTQIESESMMGFWCAIASPLLMSNDLPNIEPWAKAILLNKEAIKISQDPLGFQAIKIVDNTTMGTMNVTSCTGILPSSCRSRVVSQYAVGGSEVWARPLVGGDLASVKLNTNTSATYLT